MAVVKFQEQIALRALWCDLGVPQLNLVGGLCGMVVDCFVPRSEKMATWCAVYSIALSKKKVRGHTDVRMDVVHGCGNAVWDLGPCFDRYRNLVSAECVNKVMTCRCPVADGGVIGPMVSIVINWPA